MTTFENTIPVEIVNQPDQEQQISNQEPTDTSVGLLGAAAPASNFVSAKIVDYVVGWRNKLKTARQDKVNIWNECWQLYRGLEDFTDKDDWQAKIVLPKAWSSVKQATSTIKRLLSTAKAPWQVEPINPDDLVTAVRASQMSDLARVFLDKAHYMDEFAEGLECGFIIGVGIWKVWWGLEPRERTRVATGVAGANGEFQEADSQLLQQLGVNPSRQIMREEVLEGRLMVRAVDPYNFYWLPGSKLNRWAGTIEEIEIPKWELLELAKQGMFDEETVKNIPAMKISDEQKQSWLRWTERRNSMPTPSPETDSVKLLEFYGPLVIDGELVDRKAHVLVANDQVLLVDKSNSFWHGKPPYIGYSPLSLPFRTEGVGLVEMVREIDKALSKLANMSIDTLLFKLMPLFEINLDAYENPEDLETGLTPGKILRRNSSYLGQPGITPVQFEDISNGSVQVSAALDRYHQEGALVSEIQQSIPRYRGVQSATEIETKAANQESFFGAMAADIEQQALQPLIEMSIDLILQYIDTANDPRVSSVLGLGADTLKAMSREELLELVQGDYKIKVTGITGQLQKAEMLQNLVQLMNIIGQNPQAWMPYINQDALLRRVLEAFRPSIHDIEDIVAEPATIEAKRLAASQEMVTPEVVGMIPQLVQMAMQAKQQEQQNALQQQQQQQQVAMQNAQLAAQQQSAAAQAEQQKTQMQHEVAMEAARAATTQQQQAESPAPAA